MNAAIDRRQFRNALGSFTTGVTIVTTRDPAGYDVGLTVNSFNSVSLDPPLVLWSLARSSASLHAFIAAEYFAVHILAADQELLSNRFAQRGADKFGGLQLKRGEGGVPLLDSCTARFQCRCSLRYDGGDHEIFVGEVVSFEHFDRAPLVFQGGKYAWAVRRAEPPRPQPAQLDGNALNVLLGMAYHQLNLGLRPELARQSLLEEEYWVINMVGSEEGRTVACLDALLAFTGRRVSTDLIDGLQRKGYLRAVGEGEAARLSLTTDGRRVLVETAALTKAVEEAAEGGLDYAEAQLLKQLLQRIIRAGRSHARVAREARCDGGVS